MREKFCKQGVVPTLIAFGGNALDEEGIKAAAQVLVEANTYNPHVFAVHGNGPQVQTVIDRDVCTLNKAVLTTQQEIGNALKHAIAEVVQSKSGRGLRVEVVPTHVKVNLNDPAFSNPTKPIGRFMSEEEAGILRASHSDWHINRLKDGVKGNEWRRVVPSPQPMAVRELDDLSWSFNDDDITICGGGGGVPYFIDAGGNKVEVDGVVDKDATAALLAIRLKVHRFVILTAEDGIYTPDAYKRKQNGDEKAKPFSQLSVSQLDKLVRELPIGSMGPKAEALRQFVKETGRPAYVGALKNGLKGFDDGLGTVIIP